MVVSFFHNPGAGEGGSSPGEIITMLETAGHRVQAWSVDDDDYVAALDEPADVVVVAGGDGTVAELAFHCASRGLPLAVIATGTANNIARSLGLPPELPRQVAAVTTGIRRKVDLAAARGPWGVRRFIEAAGLGLLPLMLGDRKRHKAERRPDPVDRHGGIIGGRHLMADLLRDFGGHRLEVVADGEDLSGTYLMAELMNIRACGPALSLAPQAEPGDGLLDLVMAGEDRRDDLIRYLAAGMDSAGEAVAAPGLFLQRRVRRVTIASDHAAFHTDDQAWPTPLPDQAAPCGRLDSVEITVQPGALEFIVP